MAIKKVRIKPPGYTDIVHPETQADITKYNNSNSELVATNVQSAIDEINTKIEENKTEIGNLTKADVGLDNVDNVKQATKVEFDAHLAETTTDRVHGIGSIANLDYEEGTWTPLLGSEGIDTGQSYAYQTGFYKKFGNMVIVSFAVELSAKGTLGAGYTSVKGLPFSPLLFPPLAGGGAGGYVTWAENFSSDLVSVGIHVNSSRFLGLTAATSVADNPLHSIHPAILTDNTRLQGTAIYFI